MTSNVSAKSRTIRKLAETYGLTVRNMPADAPLAVADDYFVYSPKGERVLSVLHAKNSDGRRRTSAISDGGQLVNVQEIVVYFQTFRGDATTADEWNEPTVYTVNEEGAANLADARPYTFGAGRNVTAQVYQPKNAVSVFVGMTLHYDGPMPENMKQGSVEFYAWVRETAALGELPLCGYKVTCDRDAVTTIPFLGRRLSVCERCKEFYDSQA